MMNRIKHYCSSAGRRINRPPVKVGMCVLICLSVFAWAQPMSAGSQRTNALAASEIIAPPESTQKNVNESSPRPGTLDLSNPLSILEAAGRANLDFSPAKQYMGKAGAESGDVSSNAAGASSGETSKASGDASGSASGGGDIDSSLSILMLLTVLTIAPSFLVMTTSFTRIVIVLGLLRQAMGTQWLPPTQVIVGLSLFMTLLVMAPTFDRINEQAIKPLSAKEIDKQQAWDVASGHLKDFMFEQIDHADNWDDLYMVLDYRGVDTSQPENLTRGDVDLLSIVPAFILSELKVAFLMGFRLYLPFLIIDLVISSVLVSMGMFMLPPVLISLPFKILLFVMSDGWHLVAGNILASFAIPGAAAGAT
jgi:flagellar biosynthetic protein FliP